MSWMVCELQAAMIWFYYLVEIQYWLFQLRTLYRDHHQTMDLDLLVRNHALAEAAADWMWNWTNVIFILNFLLLGMLNDSLLSYLIQSTNMPQILISTSSEKIWLKRYCKFQQNRGIGIQIKSQNDNIIEFTCNISLLNSIGLLNGTFI